MAGKVESATRITNMGLKHVLLTLGRIAMRLPARIRSRLPGGDQTFGAHRKTFDGEWYIANNPDVAGFSGNPFDHFVLHGTYEGREGRFFDANWYRRVNRDVRFRFMDGWTHYRRIGKAEGRTPRFFYVSGNRTDADVPRGFEEWADIYDSPNAENVRNIREIVKRLELKLSFGVVIRITPTDDLWEIKKSLTALKDQVYTTMTCIVMVCGSIPDPSWKFIRRLVNEDGRFTLFASEHETEAESFNIAAKLLADNVFCFLTARDVLDPTAFFWISYSAINNPGAAVIYADEDRLDRKRGRHDPYFKPQFNYELTLTHNVLGDFVVYQRHLFEQLGGFDEAFGGNIGYDLAMRALEVAGHRAFQHVPRLLNHRCGDNLQRPTDTEVVERHFQRMGRSAQVWPNDEVQGYTRIRFALPVEKPMVSIVIPTRDRVDLLSVAVGSVLSKTTYAPFEIIIVDNGSVEPQTLRYFEEIRDHRVRVLKDDRPFNFSGLNNDAVQDAAGEYICLMNNDIEILTPDWLEEMMSFAIQPDVGCVGARLWYPDGTLQHAGVLVGFHGVAGHMHKFLPRGRSGYANRAALQQSLSAVTAAVLLVRRSTYVSVGGMDENLAVAFNDVDFCLKVRDAGYRNVYTPFAEMNHYESASRGLENSPEKKARERSEIEIIKSRYGESLMSDPAYNPNLTLIREDLSFAFPPRVDTAKEILLALRSVDLPSAAITAGQNAP